MSKQTTNLAQVAMQLNTATSVAMRATCVVPTSNVRPFNLSQGGK